MMRQGSREDIPPGAWVGWTDPDTPLPDPGPFLFAGSAGLGAPGAVPVGWLRIVLRRAAPCEDGWTDHFVGRSPDPGWRGTLRPRGEIAARAHVRPAELPAAPARPATACRRLLPEPGVRRIVRWERFGHLLSSRVARPERLRSGHRLPCDVQVYEVLGARSRAAVAATALGDASAADELQPLTPAAAAELELEELLAAGGAGQRLFRLSLAGDPTADALPRPGSENTEELREDGDDGAPRPRRRAKTRGTGERGVPRQLVRPWEFRVTRAEALYDMAEEARRLGALSGILRWVRSRAGRRRRLRKWSALLQGRPLDEQLWLVRPPRAGYRDPEVRRRVGETLALAGYDPRPWLTEWEVFWRRKGV